MEIGRHVDVHTHDNSFSILEGESEDNGALPNLHHRQFVPELLQEIVLSGIVGGHEPVSQGLNPLVHSRPIEIRTRVYLAKIIRGVPRDDSKGITRLSFQVVEKGINYHISRFSSYHKHISFSLMS